MQFIHKVSKGSRFNQIYIPRGMESIFEAGDLVEVKLIKKKVELFYSRKIEINEFKNKLIREIISFLSRFKDIKQIFMVGSFLTKKIDYNDIDLLIISNKDLGEEIYDKLADKFSLKFHVISIQEAKFKELTETDPLTRSMLYYSVSNIKFHIPKARFDKNHIDFLLMMPKDLLKININSRAYYDSIRRLTAIERFLDNKEINPKDVDEEIEILIGKSFRKIKENEEINEKDRENLKKIIKNKIKKIENEQK